MVIVKQCVITQLTVRGKGTPESPIRRVTEVWDVETGQKIAENDMLLTYSTVDDKYTFKCNSQS